ncbi:uncharacterized protein LOC103718653 isoform X2 [Phoenix dactylifera]|uniref:Uncharacterized protein LOC103718653 isoform X2 n=1 Tax=Phoenix dactylifera TaxID=42345 RepID=A0A8B8ZT97_PHODC|nr:uncharacterized protein LOC103718653 isoform X2 [Phoenix dactylifera]
MTSQCWPSKSNRSSTRYWWVPMEVQSFEPNTFFLKEDVSISRAKSNAQSETKAPSNRVSTAKFISAVAGIWDYVGQPAIFHANGSLKYHDICQKDNLICYSDGQTKHKSRSANGENFCNNLTSSNSFSSSAKSNFEDLKTIKKRLLFASCNKNVSNSFICKNVQVSDSHLLVDSYGIDKVASQEVSNDLAHPYESTTREKVLTKPTSNGSDGTDDNCTIAERNSLADLSANRSEGVKTIIQANGMGQKSSYLIVRRIISEKGMLGLYRGIASNIASSAPISAIYTFTYESVKGDLLPLLPKEYHSLAHCIAGGCSSIATSFVFTPSERIKQQMQVGLQYQNCWNAMIGCLEKGGVSSLYAGWGAVLCRNIPHSIIKFYTYESLKQLVLGSAKPDASLNTLQTLVCGGLAGSTAALFTTPFDVVKTRLQTQGLDSEVGYVCFSRSHLLCVI